MRPDDQPRQPEASSLRESEERMFRDQTFRDQTLREHGLGHHVSSSPAPRPSKPMKLRMRVTIEFDAETQGDVTMAKDLVAQAKDIADCAARRACLKIDDARIKSVPMVVDYSFRERWSS